MAEDIEGGGIPLSASDIEKGITKPIEETETVTSSNIPTPTGEPVTTPLEPQVPAVTPKTPLPVAPIPTQEETATVTLDKDWRDNILNDPSIPKEAKDIINKDAIDFTLASGEKIPILPANSPVFKGLMDYTDDLRYSQRLHAMDYANNVAKVTNANPNDIMKSLYDTGSYTADLRQPKKETIPNMSYMEYAFDTVVRGGIGSAAQTALEVPNLLLSVPAAIYTNSPLGDYTPEFSKALTEVAAWPETLRNYVIDQPKSAPGKAVGFFSSLWSANKAFAKYIPMAGNKILGWSRLQKAAGMPLVDDVAIAGTALKTEYLGAWIKESTNTKERAARIAMATLSWMRDRAGVVATQGLSSMKDPRTWMEGSLLYTGLIQDAKDGWLADVPELQGKGIMKNTARLVAEVTADATLGAFVWAAFMGAGGVLKVSKQILKLSEAEKVALKNIEEGTNGLGYESIAAAKGDIELARKTEIAKSVADTFNLAPNSPISHVVADHIMSTGKSIDSREISQFVESLRSSTTTSSRQREIEFLFKDGLNTQIAEEAVKRGENIERIMTGSSKGILQLTAPKPLIEGTETFVKTNPLQSLIEIVDSIALNSTNTLKTLPDNLSPLANDIKTRITGIIETVQGQLKSGLIKDISEADQAALTYASNLNVIRDAIVLDVESGTKVFFNSLDETLTNITDPKYLKLSIGKTHEFEVALAKFFESFDIRVAPEKNVYVSSLIQEADKLIKSNPNPVFPIGRGSRTGAWDPLDANIQAIGFVLREGMGAILGGTAGAIYSSSQREDGKIDLNHIMMGAFAGLFMQHGYRHLGGPKAAESITEASGTLKSNSPAMKQTVKELGARLTSVEKFNQVLKQNVAELQTRVAQGKATQKQLDIAMEQQKSIELLLKDAPKNSEEIRTFVKTNVPKEEISKFEKFQKSISTENLSKAFKDKELNESTFAELIGEVPEDGFLNPESVEGFLNTLSNNLTSLARETGRTDYARMEGEAFKFFKENLMQQNGFNSDSVAQVIGEMERYYGKGKMQNIVTSASIMQESIFQELKKLYPIADKTTEQLSKMAMLQHQYDILTHTITRSVSEAARVTGHATKLAKLRRGKIEALGTELAAMGITKDKMDDVSKVLYAELVESGGKRTNKYHHLAGLGGDRNFLTSLLGLRYYAMLSSPWTWTKNFVDNSFMLGINTYEQTVGGLIKTGELTQGRNFVYDIYHSLGEAMDNAKFAWKNEISAIDNKGTKFIDMNDARTSAISVYPEGIEGSICKTLDYIHGTLSEWTLRPSNVLVATDDFFKTLLHKPKLMQSLREEATRQLKEANPKGILQETDIEKLTLKLASDKDTIGAFIDDATQFARKGTYTESMTGTYGKIGAAIEANPVLRIFVPFLRTNVNMLRQTADRIPIVSMLSRQADRDAFTKFLMTNGKMTPEFADMMTRWSAGSLLLSGGAMAVMSGKGYGSMDFRADKKKLMTIGAKPYTVGGINYGEFGMSRMLMSIGADAAEMLSYIGTHDINSSIAERIQDAMAGASIIVADQITQPGIFDATAGWVKWANMTSLDRASAQAENTMTRFASSFIPNNAKAMARVLDDRLRETRGIMDKLMAEIGMSKAPVKCDILGYAVHKNVDPFAPLIREALQTAGVNVLDLEQRKEKVYGITLSPVQNQELKKFRGKLIRDIDYTGLTAQEINMEVRVAQGKAEEHIVETYKELQQFEGVANEIRATEEEQKNQRLLEIYKQMTGKGND